MLCQYKAKQHGSVVVVLQPGGICLENNQLCFGSARQNTKMRLTLRTRLYAQAHRNRHDGFEQAFSSLLIKKASKRRNTTRVEKKGMGCLNVMDFRVPLQQTSYPIQSPHEPHPDPDSWRSKPIIQGSLPTRMPPELAQRREPSGQLSTRWSLPGKHANYAASFAELPGRAFLLQRCVTAGRKLCEFSAPKIRGHLQGACADWRWS